MTKQSIIVLTLLMFMAYQPLIAQDSDPPLSSLQKGSVINSGTGNIQVEKYFDISNGLEAERFTQLFFQIKHIRLLNKQFGVGVSGFSNLFIEEGLSAFELSTFALGPVFRAYFLEKNRLQLYGDGHVLVALNTELGDASGFSQNNERNFNSGLRFGANYLLSDRTGIFMEIGPEWESESLDIFTTTARAIQLNIGIQFLNNKK